jgi:hypothetical protein
MPTLGVPAVPFELTETESPSIVILSMRARRCGGKSPLWLDATDTLWLTTRPLRWGGTVTRLEVVDIFSLMTLDVSE